MSQMELILQDLTTNDNSKLESIYLISITDVTRDILVDIILNFRQKFKMIAFELKLAKSHCINSLHHNQISVQRLQYTQ